MKADAATAAAGNNTYLGFVLLKSSLIPSRILVQKGRVSSIEVIGADDFITYSPVIGSVNIKLPLESLDNIRPDLFATALA